MGGSGSAETGWPPTWSKRLWVPGLGLPDGLGRFLVETWGLTGRGIALGVRGVLPPQYSPGSVGVQTVAIPCTKEEVSPCPSSAWCSGLSVLLGPYHPGRTCQMLGSCPAALRLVDRFGGDPHARIRLVLEIPTLVHVLDTHASTPCRSRWTGCFPTAWHRAAMPTTGTGAAPWRLAGVPTLRRIVEQKRLCRTLVMGHRSGISGVVGGGGRFFPRSRKRLMPGSSEQCGPVVRHRSGDSPPHPPRSPKYGPDSSKVISPPLQRSIPLNASRASK